MNLHHLHYQTLTYATTNETLPESISMFSAFSTLSFLLFHFENELIFVPTAQVYAFEITQICLWKFVKIWKCSPKRVSA